MERIILGSGCFWGAQDILRKIAGILRTEVGYAGGNLVDPKYPQVKTGATGHAEVVDVHFDPKMVSLEKILDVFFRMHDPTTEDSQGNDIGSQYRSIIFCLTEAQKVIAQKKIQEVDKTGFWKNPVVTEVVMSSTFYPAEDFHQDYLIKNPGGYSCHFLRKY